MQYVVLLKHGPYIKAVILPKGNAILIIKNSYIICMCSL